MTGIGNALPKADLNTKNKIFRESMEDKRLKFEKGKQRELFSYFFTAHKFSMHGLGRVLGLSKTTVRGYFNEENNITDSTFQKLVSIDQKVSEYEKFVVEKLPLNWGAQSGGFATSKLINDKNSYYSKLRAIKRNKEIELAKEKKKVFKPHPLINHLKENNVDLEAVLAVCLLTDGSLQVKGNHYRISYTTIDPVLEQIILSLMSDLSWNFPSITFSKKGNSIRVSDEILGKRMISLSPNFKTSPTGEQSKEDYLHEPQPTLSFLSKANEVTKIWALRFGFTADGCISLSTYGKTDLSIACYHPTLCLEWKKFIEELGFNCTLMKTKNSWCSLAGVRMRTRASIKKFYDFGGFIEGVKISRKSRRYCGLAKNELLKQVVESGRGRSRTFDRPITAL